ncbi:Thrombospondin-1 [Araneus ventricosus]|uniref:Thrombospondin-1 n=1 Tax=Araneus ventricosus TaxID=182803 RepID=A0A4Y2BFA3_ARAVE|nr:Thrombospondin-1 [Araneus ventricosus]
MPGTWSKWGKWDQNCSVTCGLGVRRRMRVCSYKGKNKKLKCKGNRGQMTNCDTKVTCPVHGGWSTWVSWDCSVTCGGGFGTKRRTCTNPTPMFKGNFCGGLSEEEGNCNEKKCADQVYTLSPGTAQGVKDAVNRVHYSFEKREGSNIVLSCAPQLAQKIYKEYPSSVLFWTKNGVVFELDNERMSMSLCELTILEIQLQDSGVYLCSMRYAPGVVKPLTVAAVAVVPNLPNVELPEEEKFVLICLGAQLGKVYKDLNQAWFLNDTEYKNFGNASVLESNTYEIDEITSNLTGIWRCKIRHPEKNWIWTTNIIRLKVLPPLPLYLKLLKNRNFLLILITTTFATVLAVGSCIGYKISKARGSYLPDFRMWRAISLLEEHEEKESLMDWESNEEEY